MKTKTKVRQPVQNCIERIAAIDIGSNSIHAAITEVYKDGSFYVVERLKNQTRLGDALNNQQMLTPKSFNRVAAVLTAMRRLAEKHHAKVRAVATHSLRVAKNGADFAKRLTEKTGVPVEVASGPEEARLVYLAVSRSLPIANKAALVVDIGGGSAEFIIGRGGEESFATSLKLGCVHLTKTFLKSQQLQQSELNALKEYVTSRLLPVARDLKKIGFDCAVGTSGTVKAIKLISLALANQKPGELNGSKLTLQEIEKVCHVVLQARTLKERYAIPGLDPKRADVIIAGVAVLLLISRIVGIQEWTVSTSALREGIVIDFIKRQTSWLKGDVADVRWRSVRGLAAKCHVDESHAWHISDLSSGLFTNLQTKHGLSEIWREYLRAAAYLHEIGLFENQSAFHKHGHYLINHSALFGFSLRELSIIACIVRYHRKRLARASDEGLKNLSQADKRGVNLCAAILRLAAALDRHRAGHVRATHLSKVGKKFLLKLTLRGNPDIRWEKYEFGIEKKYFEKSFNFNIELAAV